MDGGLGSGGTAGVDGGERSDREVRLLPFGRLAARVDETDLVEAFGYDGARMPSVFFGSRSLGGNAVRNRAFLALFASCRLMRKVGE
jgi:hypothetical protein